jgi:uncharacterized protein YndB with AHSA1/START domain
VNSIRDQIMATNELVEQPAHAIGEQTRRLAPETSFCIAAMRSVNADRQRVFHALTLPEYIETWFSAPGALIDRTVVSRWDEFFSISYSSARSEQSRILCSYRVCRRSKLLFTWRHDNALERRSSLVKIRMEGDFGRTAVHVTHLGLEPSDRQWHQDLWESSLEKMCKLF